MCIDLFRFKSNALDEQVIKAKLKNKQQKKTSFLGMYEAGREGRSGSRVTSCCYVMFGLTVVTSNTIL